jgi:excinuclease ABC subunit A
LLASNSVSQPVIRLRGVAVHNLKRINLDLPHRRLIAICGVSGSGKTSLALDTLYAEGQRRYIESFSAYTRQFLEQLDKPEAELIDGIPPAIAVTHSNPCRSNRATVGTSTEINDYLSLLFARVGQVICPTCNRPVRRDTPESAADELAKLPADARLMLGFELEAPTDEPIATWLTDLVDQGFIRAIIGDRTESLAPTLASKVPPGSRVTIILDRLTTGSTTPERLRESTEAAFSAGDGACVIFISEPSGTVPIDDRTWSRRTFSTALRCETCGRDFPDPEPQLFDFNRPLGACPECEGFGNIVATDMDRVVPDKIKSIRDGAIACWNSSAYAHELEELLALAKDYDLPVDVPFSQLNSQQLKIIEEGVPDRNFGGLNGFFRWLDRRKYKMHLRVFLSRWRSYYPCPACGGARLRPEALAVQVAGNNFADLSRLEIRAALAFLNEAELPAWQQPIARPLMGDVCARLAFLVDVGVGYVTLDRPLRTLSGGEAQRVALTATLGSSLVDMLYVLDEPSVGLHPADVEPLATAIERLRDRGNTVIVVEHEETIIRRADEVVEIGPGAGDDGGRVVFHGTPQDIERFPESRTGDWLAGRRRLGGNKRRATEHGWVKLTGARGNNLQNLTASFPLGVLCLVTGVSGAGKSTLVQQTLYPALARPLHQEKDNGRSKAKPNGTKTVAKPPLPFDELFGSGQLEDVILVDQSPIGRSPRSNPLTAIKAFDLVREIFAEQPDARTRNFTASAFSFNVAGGRCEACEGGGYIVIDMQFMADVYMRCSECNGRRYRREILEVKYRGLDIAEILDMTAREAFTFFRGHRKLQSQLKCLIDVGLDYLRIGQPATTLSGGESQRLKLATYLSAKRHGRTLFILDEPTTGLHFSDIVRLVDCFEALLDVGHSLVVVEHNLQLMKAADYIMDLGPGAAADGGRIVVAGTPEEVAACPDSITGQYLAREFARDRALMEEVST